MGAGNDADGGYSDKKYQRVCHMEKIVENREINAQVQFWYTNKRE